MSYEDKSEHTTAEAPPVRSTECSAVGGLSEDAEKIYGEYEAHRKLYQSLVLRRSEQANATFKGLRSIGLRLAEQIYMEREYSAAGKVWKE